MVDEREVAPVFTAYEQDRIAQIQRLLVHITDPDVAPLAARAGYDRGEHEAGWGDWRVAAGIGVPFDYYLDEAARRLAAAPGSEVNELIRFLDAAENRWHPRARNAIRRYVAAHERDAVEAAFFEDMPQQPEGPGVIGSLEKLLVRLAGLKASKVPGAKEAYASLGRKGLTRDLLAAWRKALDDATRGVKALPPAAVSDHDIRKLDAERLAAYERLNLWYIDWGDVLRDELGYHQLVRLGLTPNKGGRRVAAAGGAGAGDEAPVVVGGPAGGGGG